MNPDVVIPIAGMITGVLTVGYVSYALVRIFKGPVGQALARRIGGDAAEPDPALLQEVMTLREHVQQLEQRLVDAEERLDFSERLLAQRAEPGRIGP